MVLPKRKLGRQMNFTRRTLILGTGALLAACTKFQAYSGPDVTRIVAQKSTKSLQLLSRGETLKRYEIFLGFAPDGAKEVEGDGKTPEGSYVIDRRNPNSAYHLSLGISYPNEQDIARALAKGQSPGGDIFIHGQKNYFKRNRLDWTAGCISVSNREIEEIYAMVPNGTPIDIYA